jgi:hypothetical protein
VGPPGTSGRAHASRTHRSAIPSSPTRSLSNPTVGARETRRRPPPRRVAARGARRSPSPPPAPGGRDHP